MKGPAPRQRDRRGRARARAGRGVSFDVAALYVDPRGPYPKMPGVDCWDEARDARNYTGPWPVVAHPPCGRWCRLAAMVEAVYGYRRGDDGGCFAAALAAVRAHGGVLEHPAWSEAWPAHGLPTPARWGWQRGFNGEWVCEVSQAAYDHRAPKPTWLLFVGTDPPPANWARPPARGVISGARNRCKVPLGKRVWSREASRTPPAFAEFLIALARSCRRSVAA